MQAVDHLSPALTGDEAMATQEERIKGLETQTGNIRERLAKIEGGIESKPTESSSIKTAFITFAFGILAAYLAWLGHEVIDHGRKLAAIYELLAPESLKQAALGSENPERAKQAASLLTTLRQKKHKISPEVVVDAGKKFVQSSTNNPEAWNAVLAALDYKSFLNKDIFPVPRNIVPVPPNQMVGSFEIKTDGPLTFDLTWSNEIVPIDQSYIFESLGKTVQRSFGHPYLLLHNPRGGSGKIVLDGFQLRSVIFEGMPISYSGGQVNLDHVYFLNCTFDVQKNPTGIQFANAVLTPDAATNFQQLQSATHEATVKPLWKSD